MPWRERQGVQTKNPSPPARRSFLERVIPKRARRALGAAAVGTGLGLGSLGGAPVVDATQEAFSSTALRPNFSQSVETPHSLSTTQAEQTQERQELGEENAAEFMLMPMVEQFKQERLRKLASDPAYAERVDHELVHADILNFLYLGVDQTRDRPNDFNGLKGNADSFMIITFNPHTFETNMVSIPRDTYAPELNDRINSVTLREDGNDLARTIAEEATAKPIDRVVKTNIDFIPEFLDTMFPQGLEIDVPHDIHDEEYPDVNYGTKVLDIQKGKQVMTGKELLEYARSRHNTTDFNRSERQRQIIAEVAKQLAPRILEDFRSGKTRTLENLKQAFKIAKANENLASELDFELVFDQIEKSIQSFNTRALVKIAVNSIDEALNLRLGSGFIKTWGPDRGEQGRGGLENLSDEEQKQLGIPYVLKVEGTTLNQTTPTVLGNNLDYWKLLREQVSSEVLGR